MDKENIVSIFVKRNSWRIDGIQLEEKNEILLCFKKIVRSDSLHACEIQISASQYSFILDFTQ